MTDRGPFIQTYTGKRFYFFDPQPDDICIEDIAHHLACINRYNGAARFPISVAQHSCYVHDLCNKPNKLWGLLHDAEEAYWTDIPKPIKNSIYLGEWKELVRKTRDVIMTKFGLPLEEPIEVKYFDTLLLGNEHRQLMVDHFDLDFSGNINIMEWEWRWAKERFIYLFERLT